MTQLNRHQLQVIERARGDWKTQRELRTSRGTINKLIALGRWFVWVHSDYTPAWGYEGPDFAPHREPSDGELLADNILSNYREAG